MKFTLYIFFTLSLSYSALSARDNPFMHMAEKKYADYSAEWIAEYLTYVNLDTAYTQHVIPQIEEVAQKTGSLEWKLRVDFLKLELFGRFYKDDPDFEKELLSRTFKLLENVKKANIPQLELMIRQKIIDYYWIYFKNYEAAFEQYALQAELLQKVSAEDIPEKDLYYFHIADAHYHFKDFPQAIAYYTKILEEKEVANNQRSKQHARNGIGLSWRYGYNDLDRSDSSFQSIMQIEFLDPEITFRRDNWNGIAQGNMGYNMILRGEYDRAIPLLKSSIENMLKYEDFAFASGPAINLADIYMRKGDLLQAKHYIDRAWEYYNKMPRDGRLPRIYEVMNKYYAATGNAKLSMAYMDSTLAANKQYEDQFNAMILLRMEQKESAQRQSELAKEKEMRQQTQLRLLILSVGFIIISGLLGLLFIFYRRKRAAHRILARKLQELAQASTGNINMAQNYKSIDSSNRSEKDHETHYTPPDETDFSILKAIEQLMSEEKLYRDSSLTVDVLAQSLGAKRYIVSDAINRCTHKSFNTFVNEYRVNESILLLSEKRHETVSFEGIAFDTGFNDRRNFNRVFKKTTGLSPSQFVNNLFDD